MPTPIRLTLCFLALSLAGCATAPKTFHPADYTGVTGDVKTAQTASARADATAGELYASGAPARSEKLLQLQVDLKDVTNALDDAMIKIATLKNDDQLKTNQANHLVDENASQAKEISTLQKQVGHLALWTVAALFVGGLTWQFAPLAKGALGVYPPAGAAIAVLPNWVVSSIALVVEAALFLILTDLWRAMGWLVRLF